MSQSRSVRAAFVALFFATGISGLGYQVLWAKAFAAGIGHEFPAVLAVITAFMSGLALGAFLHERVRALQSYGWLEIAIGVWAAATTAIIPAANRLIVAWLGVEPHPAMHWFTVFAAVFVVLLPATLAMGATFPAIQRFAPTLDRGRNVGLLYSANTAGAMFGAIAAAFWLMPSFGIPRSILILAALNLVCGAIALKLGGTQPVEAARRGRDGMLAVRLFATGFLGIAFEIAMIRGLAQVLENTVFTFAALLATYLCATAAGAAVFHRCKRVPRQEWLFAALALGCVAGGIMLRTAPGLYHALRSGLGESLASVAIAEVTTAAAVLFLPAFVMGATFAALAEASLRVRSTLSWPLALNTCGAAFAPMAVGLFLLPAVGLKGSIAAISLGYAALAGRSRWVFAAIPVALAALLLPTGRDLLRLAPGERVIFFKDGAMATTAVIESTNGARVLKVNNRFQMGGTPARIAEQRHADIPLLLHPAPKRALFVGLGTGITYGTSAYYPEVEADGVELLPEVSEAARLFQESAGQRQEQVYVADGRRFVLASTNRYDVVVADLFHPAQDGSGLLYTREHFAAIRSRLNESGLFCQWLPVFQMDLETLRIVIRTFLEVFPNGEAWLLRFNVDTPVIGLIARQSQASWNTSWVEDRAGAKELAAHLRNVALGDSIRLFGCFLAGPGELRRFAGAARMNTDAHPRVMFEAPRLAFRKRDDASQRLLQLLDQWNSEVSLPLEDSPFRARVAAFITARDLYLRGLVLEGAGHQAQATAAFLESARRSADFTPAYARVLALATALSTTDLSAAQTLLEQLIEAQPNIPVARQLLERLKR